MYMYILDDLLLSLYDILRLYAYVFNIVGSFVIEGQDPEICKSRCGDYVSRIIDHISTMHPYWNETGGSNHLFVFPWDQASGKLKV